MKLPARCLGTRRGSAGNSIFCEALPSRPGTSAYIWPPGDRCTPIRRGQEAPRYIESIRHSRYLVAHCGRHFSRPFRHHAPRRAALEINRRAESNVPVCAMGHESWNHVQPSLFSIILLAAAVCVDMIPLTIAAIRTSRYQLIAHRDIT